MKVPFPAMQGVNNIELWFAQMRSWFNLNNISADKTKFNLVVSHLRQEVLEQVEHIVCDPPAIGAFEALKTAIIDRFADSERTRVHKLISGITLGDKKPSTLLQEMRRANISNDEKLLKNLWMQRLPMQAQLTVGVAQGSLAQVAELADTLLETLRINGVNTSSSGVISQIETPVATQGAETNASTFEKKFDELSKALVASIQQAVGSNTRHRSPSRSRSESRDQMQSRSRSASRARAQSPPAGHGSCWYHYNFGANARKCGKDANPPKSCDWVSKN